jgi:hypothetical protein
MNISLRQGRRLRRFWVRLPQLPRSHPFTVRRLERLYRIGLFQARVQGAEMRAGPAGRPGTILSRSASFPDMLSSGGA